MLARECGLSYKASTMGTPDSRGSRFRRGERLVLAGCVVLALLACAETAPSTPPPTTAASATAGKEVSWADMVKEQRIDYMKSVVLPRMKQAFTQFSPDRYSKMNCVTCHGDGAADGSFKMPNPRLPVLPNSSDGFKELAAEKPAVMDFMRNDVKPKMAAMLGMPEWTPETKTGFGCGACHTTAQ
jgi:cytochrome c553